MAKDVNIAKFVKGKHKETRKVEAPPEPQPEPEPEDKNQLKVPQGFTPNKFQRELFQAMERGYKRAFLMWHRRLGKDMACLAFMFKEMWRRPGIYYFIFPSYTQGKKVLWEARDSVGFRWLNMMPGFYDPGGENSLVKRVMNNDMVIECTNGSIFRIVGSDNIDSLMGTNPIGCVFSEFSLQDPKAWEYISPILAENKGWAIFQGTPRGKNHFFHLYNSVKKKDNWFVSTYQTYDPDEENYTGIISPENIEEEKQIIGRERAEQEYGCRFITASLGTYYGDMIDRAWQEERIGEYPPDYNNWTETAWDLGMDDSTAIWFIQRTGSAIHLVDYHEEHGKDLPHYVQVLKEKNYRYKWHYLPHDGNFTSLHSGLTSNELLRKLLDRADVGGNVDSVKRTDIKSGIDAVRYLFTRFRFNEKFVRDGLEKLGLYHRKYDPKRGVYLNHPVHDHASHAADALRTFATADSLDENISEMFGTRSRARDLKRVRIKNNVNPLDY